MWFLYVTAKGQNCVSDFPLQMLCISSIESDVYNKKKIQMFVVNMTFISSSEMKKCIFHSCLWHSWNIHFFTSLDEIKVIFTPNIWISSIYLLKIFVHFNSLPYLSCLSLHTAYTLNWVFCAGFPATWWTLRIKKQSGYCRKKIKVHSVQCIQ